MKTWLFYLFSLISSLSFAGEFRLAAAANLQPVIQSLGKDFTHQTGHRFQTSFGASGKLFAQLNHGAPFDV
ncbi:MAG: substrate-binding domain-containing protein, partial [Deefgea sp.]